MTNSTRVDPNDPNLKEGQRIAGLMETEMRKHKPSIDARIYAVMATVAFNCATMARSKEDASTLLETIMDSARGAIPGIMAAKNTGNFNIS
jgi:hypothetical protein